MNRGTLVLYATALLTTACQATTSLAGPAMEPADAAEQRTSQWMNSLGDAGYTATIREQTPTKGLAPYCHFNVSVDCSKNLRSDLMIYQEGDTHLSLGFSTQLTPDTSLEEVQAALSYVALDQLPTPGLTARGWRISPGTPVSSFKEGVTITGYDGRRVQVSIDTSFYAVDGAATTKRCEPPADASAPLGCTFSVRRPLAAHVLIDLPVFAQP